MWHPYLQIGKAWVWRVDYSVDKEMAGWTQPKSQWLSPDRGQWWQLSIRALSWDWWSLTSLSLWHRQWDWVHPQQIWRWPKSEWCRCHKEGIPCRGTWTNLGSGPIRISWDLTSLSTNSYNLGQEQPQWVQTRRTLGEQLTENSPLESKLWVLVNEKLFMIWPCALTAQKANDILGCNKRGPANRLR